MKTSMDQEMLDEIDTIRRELETEMRALCVGLAARFEAIRDRARTLHGQHDRLCSDATAARSIFDQPRDTQRVSYERAMELAQVNLAQLEQEASQCSAQLAEFRMRRRNMELVLRRLEGDKGQPKLGHTSQVVAVEDARRRALPPSSRK